MADPLDVVYIVREGEANDELRYSLRSLRNLPHAQVWIVGYRPSWVKGVEHVPTKQAASKWVNATNNYRAAASHAGISERFLLFNDDFFVVEPVTEVPLMHRGPVSEVAARFEALTRRGMANRYAAEMRATADLLGELGLPDPMSYELHTPIPFTRTGLLKVLDIADVYDRRTHKRTLFGNLYGEGAVQVDDVKVHRRSDQPPLGPFWSSSDGSFRSGVIGRVVRRRFPDPGPYERRL